MVEEDELLAVAEICKPGKNVVADLDVAFASTPITADASDLNASGVFHFTAGSTIAVAAIVLPDNNPELAEDFSFTLSSTSVPLIRTQVFSTIINDEFPR